MTTTRGARIEIEALDVAYGRTPVLSGIGLDVAPGSFVALIGASGCGKTTLLRTLSGFLRPSAGRIRFDGADVTGLPPERRGTAMVFQSYALWPHMTVAQNIAYGLKLRGWSRADRERRVAEMLALLDLGGLGERKVTALSGGQRQRVALGRALAVSPPILLLDEPLSNLDARIRLAMRHEIRALQQRLGFTAVHVTHDQEEAMVMADEIVILDRGRIVQAGRPEEVYTRPASPLVASFLGADNVIEAVVQAQGDGLVLRLAGGQTLPATRDLAAPGPCRIHFRRDAVALLDAERTGAGGLSLDGVVEQVTYPGGRHRLAVATAAGRFLVDHDQRIPAGSSVRLHIPAPALHVYAGPDPTGTAHAA